MTIAVNTRFLLSGCLEGYGYFINEVFRRIVKAHPEHQFIFIFDRPYEQEFVFEKNVTPVVAGPPARHPLLWKFWYNYKVPALLRKYKASVFVSCDGFCSLRTKLPQCLVVHDLAFLHYPGFIKRSHLSFYKKYTPKFLQKAAAVATVSAFSKNDILQQYTVTEEKINVVYSAAKNIFRPLDLPAKQKIKDDYTGGAEYFIYAGSIHPRKNLMNLLKAFSVFKKRLQSNMKLVIAGRLAWQYESFEASLKAYKYRSDVILTGYVEEEKLAGLIGAAYGMVYPSFFEGFGVPPLEAMQADVPVITSSGTAMEEILGDSALYAAPASHTAIAEKMMLLYKDEGLRKQLIEKGRLTANKYSWDKTASLLWQSVCKAAGIE